MTEEKIIQFKGASKDPKKLGEQIRKKKIKAEEIGKNLKLAQSQSRQAVYSFTRGLISTQKTKKQFINEGEELFKASLQLNPSSRKMLLKGMLDETGRAGSLFLIQHISVLKKAKARAYMKDLLRSGGTVSDVAMWLQLAGSVLRKHNIKASNTAEAVVDAVGDAAEWVVDTVEDGVDAVLESIDAIIDAVTDAGAAIVNLFEDVASWTADQIADLLAALIEAGIELGEFVAATFDWTYAAVSSFVRAAFEVGFVIADLLETVVSESYFVLRRFINGIIENLGPIGEIMDFVLTQIEDATSALWRRALLAIRFAEGSMLAVLDWMANQTGMVFEAIINAWESIGEDLITLYEWARGAAGFVWEMIGEVTVTLGNSIYYVYNFLARSGTQFIFDFTRGLIRAGTAIGGLIGWAVDQAIEICGEVLRGMLDIGVTIGQMLIEVVQEPRNALNIFINALTEIGQTIRNVLEATIIETAGEFLDEVLEALMELGNAVIDILRTTLELGGAYLAIVISNLFNRLGTYRAMRPEEIADARTVFGNSLDYDLIFLSTEDPLNEIIFGVQDFFSQDPDSRAFVTSNLINFDVDDGEIDRPTLIHELTHVWQSREVGGIYMAEAIIAQTSGAGYNYGYDSTPVAAVDALTITDHYDGTSTEYTDLGFITGEGGDDELNASGGNLEAFNREQQGQILMHWFVRTQLEIRDDSGAIVNLDATPWQPYRDFVFNS